MDSNSTFSINMSIIISSTVALSHTVQHRIICLLIIVLTTNHEVSQKNVISINIKSLKYCRFIYILQFKLWFCSIQLDSTRAPISIPASWKCPLILNQNMRCSSDFICFLRLHSPCKITSWRVSFILAIL